MWCGPCCWNCGRFLSVSVLGGVGGLAVNLVVGAVMGVCWGGLVCVEDAAGVP